MTCCINIIINPGYRGPKMIVRDVPNRRSGARILTESLADHAGNIPV